jgi:predicted O-methyltransferase YrrM
VKSLQSIRRRLSRTAPGIPGGTSADEGEFLARLASSVSKGVVVEIGSHQGRSAIALARGSLAGSKVDVFAIDPHEPFKGLYGGTFGPADRQAFYQHIAEARVGEIVRLISLPGPVAATGFDRPVALLFIDGDHSLPGVTKDFEAWSVHLMPDALVAFDDAADPQAGPFQLIRRLLDSGAWLEQTGCGKIRTLKRRA